MSATNAREAVSRLNLQVVAVAPHYGALAFANDLAHMAKTDPVEANEEFMQRRRGELCEAYGLNQGKQDKPFAFAGGVAIIPVSGTLINRFGGSYGGYVTGYNFIRRQLALALADDDVKGILLDVNSYGGEAAGCFEVCAEIYKARVKKPIMSYVDSNSYSAGYAVARAAGRMVCTPSGGAGSIGVLIMHVSMEKMIKEWGLDITFIQRGDHKTDGNPYEALPDKVKANLQLQVNKTGDTFATLMAKYSGMTKKAVDDTQAACYMADEALSLGLIDAIAPPEEAVQAFLVELSGSKLKLETKGPNMADTNEPGGANDGTQTAATPAPAPVAAAPAAAATPAAPDAAQVANTARTAERERMTGIMGCAEAKGREKQANHIAMNTDMSVADAQKLLAASAVEKTDAPNRFQQAMDQSEHPQVGAEGGAGGGDGKLSVADRIKSNLKLATGYDGQQAKK